MKMSEIILFYGLLTSFLLTILILISLYIQPRIWITKLPQKVQNFIPEKTKKEKIQAFVVFFLFIVILFLFPVVAVTQYVSQPTFLEIWLITFSIYFIFNLTDLLIIDWLIICTITPGFIQINGVDISVYKNYSKHLIDFFKGIILMAVFSFLSSLISYFISQQIHS